MPVKRTSTAQSKSNTIDLPSLEQIEPGQGRKVSVTMDVENVKPESQDITDFEHSDWRVFRQDDTGWTFVVQRDGRPYEPELQEELGPGKYRLVPIDEDGRPVQALAQVVKVASARASWSHDGDKPAAPAAPAAPAMDPMLQMMMQGAAEEKREARARAEKFEREQKAWQQQQSDKEWERREAQERIEREEREAARKAQLERWEREDAEKQRREDRFNAMMVQGVTLVTSLAGTIAGALANRPEPKSNDEVTTKLLTAVLADQRGRSNSTKETLEMLMVLDKMAETRAQNAAPREDDDPMKAMMTMLPLIMAGKSGGGGLNPQQIEQIIGDQMRAAFKDPETIQRIAAENPDETAKAFLTAVRANPALGDAVSKALDSDTDEE